MDVTVLAAMQQRVNFEKYARFVKPTSLSEESWIIFQGIGEWLQANPSAEVVDWEAYGAWLVMVRLAKAKAAKLESVKAVLEVLANHPPAEADMQPLIEALAKRDFASRIADHTLRIADGDHGLGFDEVDNLVTSYHSFIGNVNKSERSMSDFSLEELESVNAPGLEWRLKALRDSAGDVRKGDLVVVGMRPDTGKTTFLASEVTHMAETMDEELDVYWFNNEEQGAKVKRRIVQAALGWDSYRMNRDLPKALAEYAARMGRMDRIKLVDNARLHSRDVERLLKRGKPGLIVIDQLAKVHGFGSDGVETMTAQFNWGRELAKEYAPVMVAHQVGFDGENRKWIEQGMLYGGKTGPQGEADLIITMGRLTDMGNTRYLYLPKNKMQTPGDPTKRNGRYEIEILPDNARFKEYQ